MIRRAILEELPQIMNIFVLAKEFMQKSGNPNQWINGYPSEDVIVCDIRNENFYVEVNEGKITGCFAFIIGNEPTYSSIEGKWLDNEPYGTVHRLASDGSVPGFAGRCFAFCRSLIPNLRIDTHKDNIQMQGAVKRYGFQFCGIITLANGSPRLAYQLPHPSTQIRSSVPTGTVKM